jgi:hypothetical protein
MLHMTPHQTFTLGLSRKCSMTHCGCCDPNIRTLCLFTAPETWKVASSENIIFVRRIGSEYSVRRVTGKIVSPLVVLWFHLLQKLHLVCIETAAFRELYAQLLMASAVPVKPNELTSLDFGWTPYVRSLPSYRRHVIGLLRAIPRPSKSPETCFATFWFSLRPVLLSDKYDETSFATSQWIKPRKPHKNSCRLLSWRHLSPKWQKRTSDSPWTSLKL